MSNLQNVNSNDNCLTLGSKSTNSFLIYQKIKKKETKNHTEITVVIVL